MTTIRITGGNKVGRVWLAQRIVYMLRQRGLSADSPEMEYALPPKGEYGIIKVVTGNKEE